MRNKIKELIKAKLSKPEYPIQAESLSNGIKFYSNEDVYSYVIATGDGVEVKNVQKKLEKLYTCIFLLFIVLSIIMKRKEEYILEFLIENAKTLIRVCVIIYNLKSLIDFCRLMKDKKRKRFHGAEHKVINAYKVLQRSPKLIEEIKGYPIFCKECGTNLTIKISMISVVIFISTFAKTTMINTITTVIIIILIIRLFSTGKRNFFQYITAEEPTETEMEVALSGIIEWEKMEQEYKFSKSRI